MNKPQVTLAELMSRAKAAAAAKEAEKAAKAKSEELAKTAARRPLTAEELELRERADWEPKALVLIFDAWECSCGASGDAPGGLMIYSQHRRMSVERLVAPRFESQVDPSLPRRHHYEKRVVALCPFCAEGHGFLTKHVPVERRASPVLGQFAGEGAGFVAEWKQLTQGAPDERA